MKWYMLLIGLSVFFSNIVYGMEAVVPSKSAFQASRFVNVQFVNATQEDISVKIQYKQPKEIPACYVVVAGKRYTLKNQNFEEINAYEVFFKEGFHPFMKSLVIDAAKLDHYSAQHDSHVMMITISNTCAAKGLLSGHEYFSQFNQPEIKVISRSTYCKQTPSEPSLEDSAEAFVEVHDTYKDQLQWQKFYATLGLSSNPQPHEIFKLETPPVVQADKLPQEQRAVTLYITQLQNVYDALVKEWDPVLTHEKAIHDAAIDIPMQRLHGIKNYSQKMRDTIYTAYNTLLKQLHLK
jgi:hypothetical protein